MDLGIVSCPSRVNNVPIFKVSGKIIYFAHVPKCAGSAVEEYLSERFGTVAFLKRGFLGKDLDQSWNRSSPQHITADALAELFPADFFDASFAVVRHPVERMISEYCMLKDHLGLIPEGQGFSEWLNTVPGLLAQDRSANDNHLRPMYELLPRGTVFFQLEAGLDRVIRYLDQIAGNRNGPRTIEPKLTRNRAFIQIVPTANDLALITRLYRRDFEIFRYALPTTVSSKTLTDARPSSAAVPQMSWSRASVIQENMWLSQQKSAESVAQNVVRVIKIEGACDASRISAAVNQLLARHSILRAVFIWQNGQLLWAPKPHESLTIAEELGPVDRIAFALKPYDLEKGPLFRFQLVRTAETSVELLCGFHHLIIDGTSWPKFAHEFVKCVSGEDIGTDAPDYRDYAAWQDRWLRSAEAEPSRIYWRNRLKSLPASSSLPELGGTGDVAHLRGTAVFTLSEHLSSDLHALATQLSVSPFRIFLTVFAALLARVTKREETVLMTTLTGRKGPLTADMQGPFINLGVICAKVASDTSLADLLGEVNEQLREAVKHQEYPLLAALREEAAGHFAHHPALTSALVTRLPDPVSIKAGTLTFTDVHEVLPASERDLAVGFQQTGAVFQIVWIYATHLLDAKGVAQLQRQFERLLQSAIDHPETPLCQVDILEPSERDKLLNQWNDTDVSFPDIQPVHLMFEAQAARTPRAVAVIDPERTWTYQDIDRAANRIAALLLRQGVPPRGFVMLQMHPSAAMIAAELGVMKSAAAFVPAAPEWPESRIAELARRFGASTLILSDTDLPGRLSIAAEMLSQDNPERPYIHTTLDDPIYCIFTSGSTGRPKGAVNSHRGVANYILSKSAFFGPAADDAVLATAQGTADTHVWQFFWPLICGGRVVVATRPEMVTPSAVARLIKRHAVSVADFVPSLLADVLAEMAAQVAQDFATLRLLIVGGEAMRATDTYRFKSLLPDCRVVNSYGPTETAIATICFELPPDPIDPVPIGRPIHNTRAVILDGSHLTPVGMVGELCLGGACMGLGYFDDPVETAKSFIPNPFPELGCTTLYRTGDLARMRRDGVIECLGRIDDQIKIRGQRIEPGEVEAALRRQPGISTAVVWAQGQGSDAQLVAGFTAAAGQADLDVSALRKVLRRELPVHLVPALFRQLETIPLLPGGKVDRKAVAAAKGRLVTARRQINPPRGLFEERLAVLWREIFGQAEIGRDDNFFEDLGGDSLQAMRLVASIEEHFAIKPELRWVFEAAELKELATLVAGASSDRPATAVALQRRYLVTWRGWKQSAEGLLFAQNPAGTRPPLFWCFQGEQEMMQLARALGPDQPLVGMRSGHLLQDHAAQAVEDLAKAYAHEIALCQPAGPILLGGNCQGGQVAQRVAERLVAMGRDVPLLILLEATWFTRYDGPVALLFGKDSHLNPFQGGKDPLPSFETAFRAGFSVHMVSGAHGEFFASNHVQVLAATLRGLLGDVAAFAQARLNMAVQAL